MVIKIKKTIVYIVISIIIFGIVISFINYALKSGGSTSVEEVSPQQVQKAIESEDSVVIVDVRTPEEYAGGFIQSSLLMPLDTIETQASKIIPDKNKTYYLYCRSGRRSAEAMLTLKKLGYTDVHSMTGGILEWQRAGYVLVKE